MVGFPKFGHIAICYAAVLIYFTSKWSAIKMTVLLGYIEYGDCSIRVYRSLLALCLMLKNYAGKIFGSLPKIWTARDLVNESLPTAQPMSHQ